MFASKTAEVAMDVRLVWTGTGDKLRAQPQLIARFAFQNSGMDFVCATATTAAAAAAAIASATTTTTTTAAAAIAATASAAGACQPP